MNKLTVLLAVTGLLSTLHADVVHADDLVVQGSICAGTDCVNNESFGFDTIRLRENNLRIKFDDTSASASFPSNDWQIAINDTSNGGLNKFSIDDITGGKIPFLIEAGAPTNALYIEDGGRIGIGTSTPVTTVHLKDGNTPTVRLDQDGSSGFTPQVWDLAGNEAGFFIRDTTNGSKLNFRIQPGSPAEAIFIKPNAVEMGIDLKVKGSIFTASDRNLKENIKVVESSTVLQKIETMDISTWNFKNDKSNIRHLGPMAQDFYKAFDIGLDDKHISPMDLASVALAGVQALNEKLQKREEEILQLKEKLDNMKLLEAKLTMLEKMMEQYAVAKAKDKSIAAAIQTKK